MTSDPHQPASPQARAQRGGRGAPGRGLLARVRRTIAPGTPRQPAPPPTSWDGGIDRPPPPPDCPPRWRTGPPHFVGVGAQRAGTSRWFDLIAAHPEVLRPMRAKELHFFDRFYAEPFDAEQRRAYHAYFPRLEGHKVGEWTPLYASAPWIPPLLAECAPDARLLIILRDPVERYLSGLALDITVATRRGAPLSRYAPLEAYVRGLYHLALARLLRHFDRSQLLVLQYERCTLDPRAELRRTFEFIGVGDPSFVPDLAAHPRRQPHKPALDPATRAAYVDAYSEDVSALAAQFPEIDLSLWPNFAHLVG